MKKYYTICCQKDIDEVDTESANYNMEDFEEIGVSKFYDKKIELLLDIFKSWIDSASINKFEHIKDELDETYSMILDELKILKK